MNSSEKGMSIKKIWLPTVEKSKTRRSEKDNAIDNENYCDDSIIFKKWNVKISQTFQLDNPHK